METNFWCGQAAGLVLLVNDPEQQLVLHYLLEAALRNSLLSLGHTPFSVHVVLVLPIMKLPPRNT